VTWQAEQGRDLPANWREIVAQVKRRAATPEHPKGQCEARLPKTGRRCPDPGVDVDHTGDKDDHRLHKLKLKCEHHHDKKTARQGQEAWAEKKRRAKRPAEQHPGRNLR
jgi:5-methylcytosine-specific restriction protein A